LKKENVSNILIRKKPHETQSCRKNRNTVGIFAFEKRRRTQKKEIA